MDEGCPRGLRGRLLYKYLGLRLLGTRGLVATRMTLAPWALRAVAVGAVIGGTLVPTFPLLCYAL